MYFWNIELLKNDIRSKVFDEKASFRYIILTIALYCFAIELAAYFPNENNNIWTYLLSFISVLIPVIGTIYAYKINGGENGTNFADKYFSISFVVGIRFLIYYIPLIAILIFYLVFTSPEQENRPTTFLEVALTTIWQIWLYLRVIKHIGDVAEIEISNSSR
jgi:hypothetical protein